MYIFNLGSSNQLSKSEEIIIATVVTTGGLLIITVITLFICGILLYRRGRPEYIST